MADNTITLTPKIYTAYVKTDKQVLTPKIYVSYIESTAQEETPVEVFADTETSIVKNETLLVDTDLTLEEETPAANVKYTNPGILDGSVFFSSASSYEGDLAGKSWTGSAIGQSPLGPVTSYFPTPLTELYLRFDYYAPSSVSGFQSGFAIYSDNGNISLINGVLSVMGTSLTVDSTETNTDSINKIGIKVTQDKVEFYINDVLKVNQSIYSLGNIQAYGISNSASSAMSNIIIANYDILAESIRVDISDTVLADTGLNITRKVTAITDTRLSIAKAVNAIADTELNVVVHEVVNLDTKISALQQKTILADTEINLPFVVSITPTVPLPESVPAADAVTITHFGTTVERKVSDPLITGTIPRTQGNTGVKEISINLQAKQLADTFNLKTVNEINPEDVIEGTLLDYNFKFRCDTSQKDGAIYTVTGMYDKDKILSRVFIAIGSSSKSGGASHTSTAGAVTRTTSIPEQLQETGQTAAELLRDAVAPALGLDCVCNMMDFRPLNQKVVGSGSSFQGLISTWFSWTSRLPDMQINVFIRDNTLYAIQRGREPNVIDISNEKMTRPIITKSILRNSQNGGLSDLTATSSQTVHKWYKETYYKSDFMPELNKYIPAPAGKHWGADGRLHDGESEAGGRGANS